MSSSLVSLSLNPPLTHNTPVFLSNKPSLSSLSSHSTKSQTLICRLSSPTTSATPPDPEEIRWLREEQRWLREEQRWLREEQRWIRERKSLLLEVAQLKLKIQALEKNQTSFILAEETVASVSGLMQVLKEKNLISAPSQSEKGGMVGVLDEGRNKDEEDIKTTMVTKTKTLRKGSEGEEVKAMQEALEKLGFYSGEEDVEYSSFSSGTERAVKTWQATVGASEDGIMTAELLEKLYAEQQIVVSGVNMTSDQEGSTATFSQRKGANGAPVASVTEISEIKQMNAKEDVTKVKASEHRVFLLGENRWEEPSRLSGREKKVVQSKTKAAKTKCVACRGEGRVMCMECDGTGEPNIEPQFLEWIDEGTKCPYCEGLGYTVCDVCQGKTLI